MVSQTIGWLLQMGGGNLTLDSYQSCPEVVLGYAPSSN